MAEERNAQMEARERWEAILTEVPDRAEILIKSNLPIITSQVDYEEFQRRMQYLAYERGWVTQAEAEARYTPQLPDSSGWVRVSAGSGYGRRHAWYEVVGGALVLRDSGNHDNLGGNSRCLDFEGLTVEQAYDKRDAINTAPVGHSYDGCHACTFAVWVEEEDEPPEFLAYQEGSETEELRRLIRDFLGKRAGFAELREVV